MPRLVILAVAVAVLVGAGAARAAGPPTLPAGFAAAPVLAGGPVLAGDRVAWAAAWQSRTPYAGELRSTSYLYSAASSGPASRLAQVGQTRPYGGEYSSGDDLISLAGSPGHLAWQTYDFDSAASKYGFDLMAPYHLWTLDAGARPAELCRGEEPHGANAVLTTSIALDGTALARSGCNADPGVAVTDLAQPGSAPARIASDGGPVRLAGSIVAWRTGAGFELLDRATGVRSTIGLDPAPLPAPVDDFDVAPDGTLAVIGGAGSGQSPPYVAWASAADPAWHVFGVTGLRNAGIRVRGGRIAVLVGHLASRRFEIRLLDLAGHQTTVAAGSDPRLDRDIPQFSESTHAGFDFDGTTLAWATRACDALVVLVSRVDTGAAAGPEREACPVEISPAALHARHRGATVQLRCPPPTLPRRSDACAGTLRATLAGAGRAARVPFRVPKSAVRDVRLKLPARWSRVVTRRRHVRIALDARSVTRGLVSHTRANVTLRARQR